MKSFIDARKAIKTLQKELQITQKKLAEVEGITEAYMSNKIKGDHYTHPGNFARLCDNLGLKVKIEIKAEVLDQEGNKIIDIPINNDFMDEE